ncbi:transporter substrate-binding domain-containing protein [Microbaculum marinisediminis]|uniref:Transporter substrate-binding domain-containing protein n=1 Tax=Microbaculum marinisediminis TaxID=2931392 RepID=A0AAW5R0H5_9HYPH|nr:transporter substrate-binding domain-containing protein [Microbaculum sp. A6E488]MCT8973781.1 transporter substrate-binding domain-containing protein [Microbaculum sp. A6E488]
MSKLRKSLLSIVAACGVGLTAAAVQAEPLRIATEGAYPPFNFVDANGELQGFDVEIAKALCAEMKVECTISAQAWDGMIAGLNAGQYDVIVASMSITPARLEAVNFTEPYYQAGAVLVAPKDSDLEPTAESLAGKSIGVQRASTYAALIDSRFPDASVRLYDKVENHNLDLVTGRIDGVIAQRIALSRWLESEDGKPFEMKGEAMLDPDILGKGAGIAVRKSDEELLAKLDAALATIKENGVYDEINDGFFPFSMKPAE